MAIPSVPFATGNMRRAFLVNINNMPAEMWLDGQPQNKYVVKRYVKRNLDRQHLHRIDIQMLVLARKILMNFKADLADCTCNDAALLY
ncbi:6154_t:CDS:2, partial [Paraglomus occultum]